MDYEYLKFESQNGRSKMVNNKHQIFSNLIEGPGTFFGCREVLKIMLFRNLEFQNIGFKMEHISIC